MVYAGFSRRLTSCAFVFLFILVALLVSIPGVDRVGNDRKNKDVELEWTQNQETKKTSGPGEQTRFTVGGDILWQFHTETPGSAVSTPALGDMDGDGRLEIVAVSEGDGIYCLNADGTSYWDGPFTNCEISTLSEVYQYGYNRIPPPFFSSPTVTDIDLGSEPEVIVGIDDAALCLNYDSTVHWMKGQYGNYLTKCAVTDLQGNWSGVKDELEVLFISSNSANPPSKFYEAWHVDGTQIFRGQIECCACAGSYGGSIVTQDIDGSFTNGRVPKNGEETTTELFNNYNYRDIRMYGQRGKFPNGEPRYVQYKTIGTSGHDSFSYSTPCIGNVSGNSSCEIIVGSSIGASQFWENWGGRLTCYDMLGCKKWDYKLGDTGGNGIQSSPAVCDIHCSINDPYEDDSNYEVVFGSDNGNVYCLSILENNAVKLWSFNTGGRVMSSPAICNIDTDDELEVIIGSDSGKVYCFDGDPSDGIDEGESHPGDGELVDVLWVADIGHPIGISSPVVADIDLDGVLEVVIGDTNGTITCISAGGSCSASQIDWPMFHSDLNNTGYYSSKYRNGVDIYPRMEPTHSPPSVDSLTKFVQPGMQEAYNLTIEHLVNTGSPNFSDKFHVSVEGIPYGWSVFLDTPPQMGNPNPDHVILGSGERANVTLWVRAPWSGDEELCLINITVTSDLDPFIRDEVQTLTIKRAVLDHWISFPNEIDCSPTSEYDGYKWDKISPGAESIHALTIANTGNINDTYKLELSGIPDGWRAVFIDTKTTVTYVHLSAPEAGNVFDEPYQTTVNIRVSCPEDATLGEEAWIKVTSTSLRSLNAKFYSVINRHEELLVITGSLTDVKISCAEPLLYTYPNEAASFEVIVENDSNSQKDVVFSFEGLLEGWKIDVVDEVQILIGQKRKVVINVIPPSKAPAGETANLILTGRIKGQSHIHKSTRLTTVVLQRYSFDLTIDKYTRSAEPGDMVLFKFSVQNHGNGRDSFTTGLQSNELEWDLQFEREGYNFQQHELQIDELINFTLKMQIPDGTEAGTYRINYNISGIESTIENYVRVIVNHTYALEMSSYKDQGESNSPYIILSSTHPGSTTKHQIMIMNDANGPDFVNLSIKISNNEDGLWMAWFGLVSNTPDRTENVIIQDFSKPLSFKNIGNDVNYLPDREGHSRISMHLQAGERVWLTIYVKCPESTTGDEMKKVEVVSDSLGQDKDDPRDNSVSIKLQVMYPDIVLSSMISFIEPSNEYSVGSIITITCSISNIGDIEAENVVVVMMVDGEEKGRAVFSRILLNKEQLVTFSWKAEAGKHQITIVIDPDDRIPEKNEQGHGLNNNVRSRDLIINSSPGKGFLTTNNEKPSIFPQLFTFLSLASVIGILTLFYLKRKRLV